MFFQISVTPKRSDKSKKPEKRVEEEEINILSLAPFTSNPKLFFEDINVGTVTDRKICIRNPTKFDIKLYLEKEPPGERNVIFNWKEQIIPSENEEIFIISWKPLVSGTWRDVLHLWDGNRIKRDIPIVFKSIRPKEVRKKSIGVKLKNINIPEQRKHKKSPTLKPSRKQFASPHTNSQQAKANGSTIPQIKVFSPIRRATFTVTNKENILPGQMHLQPNNLPKNTTYVIKNHNSGDTLERNNLELKSPTDENFDDSLETSPHSMSTVQSARNNHLQELPYTPPLLASTHRNYSFTPETPLTTVYSFTCSTEGRSDGDTHSRNNISGETYVKSCHEAYVTETSGKANISGATYVKETSTKANISGATYVKDTSIGNLASLQLSPVDPPLSTSMSFTNLVLSPIENSPVFRHRQDLDKISEESSTDSTPKQHQQRRKRRSNSMFDVSPSMKKRSPVKRLSQAYTKKPLHLKKFLANTKPKACANSVTNIIQHNPDLFFNDVCNPYVLAATSGVDPFMAATMYYDPQWIDEQILRFKSWMNVLLIPPADFKCHGNAKVDVAQLWQECRNKDVEKPPTKEDVSNRYNQNHRLQSLRRNAMKLYHSTQMIVILSKCLGMVNNDKFTMRADKNIHRDVGLQKGILRLLFCYNPLWLRIGLETIYNVPIRMRSNSDVLGLTVFLMENFFNEPYLLRKYKSKLAPVYVAEIKRHAIKKFLTLIYFLDQAKLQKLIPYDPCLFCKNAPIKESKDILLRFSSELFSSIGDVTKPLRLINYVLSYKQTYINEMDYGVEDLGSDLRDGVRLTRIMEILLLETNLTDLLRVPAISRLQKVYNVKLAFDALKLANFTIQGNIEPKDIVNGHKEKTLSFLWQIIYIFHSPRMTKAATIVQVWWRSEPVQNKLAKLREARKLRQDAALLISEWYRRQKFIHKLEAAIPIIRLILEEIKRNRAACKIQTCYRMYNCRKRYLRLYQSTLVIQKCYRYWLQYTEYHKKREVAVLVIQRTWKVYITRQRFLRLKEAVAVVKTAYIANNLMRQCRDKYVTLKRATVFVQSKYRANVAMKKCRTKYVLMQRASCVIQARWKATLLMRIQRNEYLELNNAAIVTQRRFRANIAMNQEFYAYQRLRNSVITIQRHLRATIAMKHQRSDYLIIVMSITTIQTWYRSILSMRCQRSMYDGLRKSSLVLQRRFRARQLMKQQYQQYEDLKRNVINVQKRFRANEAMKQQRFEYLELKDVVVKMQIRFRANVIAKRDRDHYCSLKKAVTVVENRYIAKTQMNKCRSKYLETQRACSLIQSKLRTILLMRKERSEYLRLKNAVATIQQKYRANIQMKQQKTSYQKLRDSVLTIQSHLRATIAKKKQRKEYTSIVKAIRTIQTWYKSILLMRKQRSAYEDLRKSTVVLQRRFRAQQLMKLQHQEYVVLKRNVSNVQKRFRANQIMKQQRAEYLQLKDGVVKMQRRFRANLMAKIDRDQYCRLKKAVGVVETQYIAKKKMNKCRSEYLAVQKGCKLIQSKFKAVLLMRKERYEYIRLKNAASIVQQRFRANIGMKQQKNTYQHLRESTKIIQMRFRAIILMKKHRSEYQIIRKSISIIQTWYRSILLMRVQRRVYEELRRSSVVLQRRFRAHQLMKQQRRDYLYLKQNVINVQRRFRANQAMKQERAEYFRLKKVVVTMQRSRRANVIAKRDRDYYCTLKKAVAVLESRYIAKMEMKKCKSKYVETQRACLLIQSKLRAVLLMRKERSEYLQLKHAVSTIQQMFKANIKMKNQKKTYQNLRHSVIIIQSHLRATIAMKQQRKDYITIVKSIITIQAWYKSNLAMRSQKISYEELRKSAVLFQRRFRAQQLMKLQHREYLDLKRNVINVQRRFRANQAMKQQRGEYLQLKNVVVTIQRRFRANVIAKRDRDHYSRLKKAARVIASRYIAKREMINCRSAYKTLQQAVILVQRKYRAEIESRKCREAYLKLKNAVGIFERHYEALQLMRRGRKDYLQILKTVVIIQRQFRANKLMQQERSKFLTQKEAAVKIQRHYRGFKLMQKAKREKYIKLKALRRAVHIFATRYVALLVMRRERVRYLQTVLAIVLIQRKFRAKMLMRQERNKYLKMKQATIKIQRFYRGFKSAQKETISRCTKLKAIHLIQVWSRGALARRNFAEMKKPEAIEKRRAQLMRKTSATKIQALWRGYKTRSSGSEELTDIRKRAEIVNRNSQPENTIENRTIKSTRILISDKTTMLQMITSLEDLERNTRLSQASCLSIAKKLCNELYVIIKAANRSRSNTLACSAAVGILVNIAKYPQASEYAWQPLHAEYLYSLIKAMLRCCDKENILILKLFTLLWVFGHNDKYKAEILKLENFYQHLQKMLQSCERQHKMVSKTYKGKNVSVFSWYFDLPLPTVKPDWGLDYKHSPHLFTNALHGIRSLCELFKL